MPAPGTVWATDSWDEDAWEADTWADAEEPPPDGGNGGDGPAPTEGRRKRIHPARIRRARRKR